MGFLRKLSQDNRSDPAFISIVRTMHRKISEGSRSHAPKPPPRQKTSEGAQSQQLPPVPPPRRGRRTQHQETNSTRKLAAPHQSQSHRKTSKENLIALPKVPRKVSADNYLSASTSVALRRPSMISDACLRSDRSPSVTPERKLSESVSEYLVVLSEELKAVWVPEGLREPELIVGLSEILDIDDILNISSMTNCGEPSWHLTFSTSLDQHSLSTLYKKIEQYQQTNNNGNLLIVLKDTRKHVFGTLMTSRSKHCDYFDVYNSTMLFHCRPFRPFQSWLGEQKHVVRKYADAFYVGMKHMDCGLWLNERLKTGRIQESDMNLGLASSLCLRSAENNTLTVDKMEALEYNFQIKTLECWSFSYK